MNDSYLSDFTVAPLPFANVALENGIINTTNTANMSISGYGIVIHTGFATAQLDSITPTGTVSISKAFTVSNNTTARVLSSGFTNLGLDAKLEGGTLRADNGIGMDVGSKISGHGTVNGRIAARFGSNITANGGSLTLGDINSVVGFTSDGELYIGTNALTINDANEAVLGSLTAIGNGTTGGQLTAPNGLFVEQGKNITGRGNIAGDVRNNGHVIGDGTGAGRRIIFDSPWVVSGIGTFKNVQFNGTFSPGQSPAIVTGENLAFGGTVQIELGGTSPGLGSNNHDQIIDLDTIKLIDGVDLAIMPWNGFEPELGDTFDIIQSNANIVGSFDSLVVDPYFAQLGIDFELLTTNNSISLLAVAAALTGDFDDDGDVNGSDFLAWQRGNSPNPTSSNDLADWAADYGKSESELTANNTQVPEPTSIMLVLLGSLCCTANRRRR